MSFNLKLYKFYHDLSSSRLRKKVIHILKKTISHREFITKIKNKNSNLTLIYDSYNASNRYGDFIYFCMLARVLILKGHKIHIIFLKKNELDNKSLFDELKRILKIFLRFENYKFEEMNFQEFSSNSHHFKNILFEELVINRLKSYVFYYDLIIYIYKQYFYNNDEKFLINGNVLGYPFINQNNDLKNKKYLCLICRYADGDDASRDFTEDEFLNIRKYLIREFKDISIVVVSDNKGCNYYKSLEPDDGMKLTYSKDLIKEDDYLKDASLILSSNLVIQVRGGGIIIPALFSKTPYFLCWKDMGNERITNKRKLTPWSIKLNNQFFYRTNKWDENLFNQHKFQIPFLKNM